MAHLLARLGCCLCLATLAAAAVPGWVRELVPADDRWRQAEQVFVFNNGAEPQTLDPALMTGVPEGRLALALFEGLVGLHPETLEPVPGVAERWEVSEDATVYTFHLRADARWSDGERVTAQQFADSWKRVLTPETASEYAYQCFPIANAQAYYKGEVEDFAEVGVEVVDERTLRVRLGSPCPYFLDLAAFATLYPVRTDVIAAHGERWTRPEHFVGNGPFDLADWEPRRAITLKKNPRWHGAEWVRLEEIVARPYEDLDTAVQLFRQRKLHWLPGVPTTMVEELKHDPDYYVSPYLGTYFYRFNCTKPPFDDVHVRRAFSLAIDRRAITEHILRAGQQPASYLCPPGCAGYEPVEGLDYDMDAAQAEWARSRYGGDDAAEWPSVELLYNTSESHKQVAETVAQQWERAFGVRVSLRNCEWKVYLSRMTELDYDVMRSSWIGDYNDPNTFFDMFVTDGGNNRTGWSSERYDALLAEAAAETGHDRRLELFREMERILVADGCPIAPIYIYVNQGMLSENVLGWHENIRDHHPFQYLWMEE